MTIFRVNIDRDEANVVNSLKKEDPELAKIIGEWNKVSTAYDAIFKKHGAQIIKMSRRVYKVTDEKLKKMAKDNKSEKSDVETIKRLRKQAYDVTVSIKKHMQPY